MDKKKEKKTKSPELHEDLSGFSISINEFGEMVSSLKIEDINTFLNEQMNEKQADPKTDPKTAQENVLEEE